MKVLEPGHDYELAVYDQTPGDFQIESLTFMERVGEKYPGNIQSHPGTNCQEVLRVLIDRLIYLNTQIPCEETTRCISHARDMIYLLEMRAKRVKGKTLKDYITDDPIETISTCKVCGHIYCTEIH